MAASTREPAGRLGLVVIAAALALSLSLVLPWYTVLFDAALRRVPGTAQPVTATAVTQRLLRG